MATARFKRVLLKLSGEVLAGERGYGYDPASAAAIAAEIKAVHEQGVQLAIVIGGGNIFRGVAGAAGGMNRSVADMVGMLATVMNSLMFRETLAEQGVCARVLSGVDVPKAAGLFTRERALAVLDQGDILILAGGTGNPYFTTDSAAALRCAETECEALLKATKVDGVYDTDPATNPDAKKIPELTHQEALTRGIRVMDPSAFSLCMDNNIPIIVFKLTEPGNIRRCIEGLPVGSLVKKGE
jgi:uridylate kinase